MRLKNFFRRVKAKLLTLGLTVTAFIPAVLMIAFLCFGFMSGTVAADTGSSTSIDVSSMIDLVMSLLPLIIVLVIVKALMNAFKGL